MISHSIKYLLIVLALMAFSFQICRAQVTYTSDGFGGRSWYTPGNLINNSDYTMYAVMNGQLYQWGYWEDENNGSGGEDEGLYINGPAPHLVLANRNPITGSNNPGYVLPHAVTGFDAVTHMSVTHRRGGVINDNTAYLFSETSGNFGLTPISFPDMKYVDVTHGTNNTGHVAMIKNDGTVWSVGNNRWGAFGNGSTNNTWTNTPVQMNTITTAVRVATFYDQMNSTKIFGTIVLKDDGTVWVAGAGARLLSGSTTNSTPQQVPNLTNIIDVKSAASSALALDNNGDVWSWGYDYLYPHGDGTTVNSTTYSYIPKQVAFPTGTPPIVAIFTNYLRPVSYALDEAGTLWYWGRILGNTGVPLAGVNDITGAPIPTPSAYNVAELSYGVNTLHLTRNSNYPEDERVWVVSGSSAVGYMAYLNEELIPRSTFTEIALNKTTLDKSFNLTTWALCRPSTWGLDGAGTIGGTSIAAVGTVDCNGTEIIGNLIEGTPAEISLKLTLDVATTGTADFTVSGSGFTVSPSPYTLDFTTTGIQDIYVTLQYDGSTFGATTFDVSGIGSCNANLAGQNTQPVIQQIISLDTCTPITPSTISKQ